MHKPTKEELQVSRLTWNTLRQSDRRILCREANLPSEVWWESIAWDDLTEKQRLALMQFDWNSAFASA